MQCAGSRRKVDIYIAHSAADFEVGAFNPTSISDHDSWNKSMAYAGKVVYRLGNVKIEAGAQTLSPDSVRVNLLEGVCVVVGWTLDCRRRVHEQALYK